MITRCKNITEATFVVSTATNTSGKSIYKFLHLGQYGESVQYSFVWFRRWFENNEPCRNNNYQLSFEITFLKTQNILYG